MSAFFPPPPRAPPYPDLGGQSQSQSDQAKAVHAREVHAARARPAWSLLLFACLRKQQASSE